MARTDDAWVRDIISAIVDIRADTADLDFVAFVARPAIVRSVLYSIAIMGEAAKISVPRSRPDIPMFLGVPSRASGTESSTNISAPTHGEFGTS
jgi:uncharacterized protein with HEPN domain